MAFVFTLPPLSFEQLAALAERRRAAATQAAFYEEAARREAAARRELALADDARWADLERQRAQQMADERGRRGLK